MDFLGNFNRTAVNEDFAGISVEVCGLQAVIYTAIITAPSNHLFKEKCYDNDDDRG